MSDSEQQPDLSELIKTNPAVDAEQVRKVQAAIEDLRAAGVAPSGYDLESPHQRRPGPKSSSRSAC